MSDAPNLSELEALRAKYPDAVIAPKQDDAPKPRVETLRMKKAQGINQVSNVRTIRINDDAYPVDEAGNSKMLYTISVTITSSMDDHDDELELIQKAATEFVRNIHNNIN
jgi:hypothetical protein